MSRQTLPKGRPTVHRPSRNLAPTVLRGLRGDPGHFAPLSRVDNAERPWKGTSRIIDRAARRKAMRRSWQAKLAVERRATVAENNHRRAVAAIDAELAS